MEIVGESIISAALEVLFSKLASPDLLKFARREKVIVELEGWKKELRIIDEVLDEAEEKQITKLSVKEWVEDLRDLAYDMEDVLDEFSTEMLRRRLMSDHADQVASTSKVRSIVPTCFTGFNPVGEVKFNFEMGAKIKAITRRLDEISRRKAELGLKGLEKFKSGAAASTWQRPPTTCLINEPVHGRDEDKKVIIEMLLKDEAGESNFGVIPIVGIGGMGKTTVAQFIYKDEEIVKHFEPRAWVYVSYEGDVEKLTKTVLNAVSPDEVRDGDDFNQLQQKLSEKLSGKRFLLVLDDVWNIKSYEQWSQLRAPLKSGARGSKIVLTTRDKNVASLMRADNYHHLLMPLSHDDCWSVFVEHAFERQNVDECPNLKSIGEKIVQKCSGLPLAAKMVGGLLRSKFEVEAWKHVLDSNIWNVSECGIIPILRLSYQHLSPCLKRCFAYCALFPKGYEFDEKQLTLLWMAEGFIYQAKEDNRPMEDVGAHYFNELLSRCFFQPSSYHKLAIFVMHDLIYDLAQHVAAKICFNLENKHQIFESTRYLSFERSEYDTFKKFEVGDKLERLRTFVALPINMVNEKKCYLSTKVLDELLPKLIHLRVLSLSVYEIRELPETIGDLKHLRYLNLSHTTLKCLPEKISSLYNLQSLILCNCRELKRLPMGIVNLINLRHLDISGSTKLEEMPPQIGNLTNLQTLFEFILSKGNGSRIKELRNLLNLQGELTISGLDNVMDPEDAMYVDMKGRPNIEDLTMEWSHDFGNSRDESNEMKVLEWLQPHQNLKYLSIIFYGGKFFPGWIGDPSFSRVMELSLLGCKKCTSLPPLGGLPLLKHLEIDGMSEIERIGDEFYGKIGKPFRCLEYLKFGDMPEWTDWLVPNQGEGADTEAMLPCLRELVIIKCPRLTSLPDQMPSLVNLHVEECQQLTISIPRFPSLTILGVNRCNEGILKSGVLVDVPSLTQLYIWEISNPGCLWAGLAQSLTALKTLVINGCDEVPCLRGLENLGGLQEIFILRCDGVVSLEEQGLPPNLRVLEAVQCSKLEKLPNALHTLTTLTHLAIRNCPKFVSFPKTGLPSMLRYFLMTNCPSFIDFPKGDWPTALKVLLIEDCEKLESLPEGIMRDASSIHNSNDTCRLEWLGVWGCPSLKSIPRGNFPSTLKLLWIQNCQQLEPIPWKMLQNLTSLRDLDLCNCPDVMSSPNLRKLGISYSNNTKRPPSTWGLHTFTSLKGIIIRGPFPDVMSFSNKGSQFLPTSLTSIHIIDFPNLESIASTWLQSLISLRTLGLYDCPKLRFLVPKEGLPPTLSILVISKCPILKKRCVKDKGKDWPKIAHIPYVEIDGILQQ